MMSDSDPLTSLSPIENLSELYMMEGYEVLEPALLTQTLEPSCILILILTGKIMMNTFIFGARTTNYSSSFMGYFCLSLAFADFALLISISSIHYFQDFAIWGIRITTYHICLLTQIISHTYGILHYPVFIVCGLDCYLMIVRSVSLPRLCTGFLYAATMLLLWTMAFIYTLNSPAGLFTSDTGVISNQCTFYISYQSFFLSAVIVIGIFLVLAICFFELVEFIKSMKITSYAEKTVILFSYANEWPIRGTKRLMTTLLLSFLGTWLPFVILQMIILLSCAHIPGYMDLNVPWLYFINSLLIGICYGIKYPTLKLTEKTLLLDPFIEWKYCVLPFYTGHTRNIVLKEMPIEIVI
uniref:G-protein coupled receptors family 1 profile domain-containing protein n=1 Tax=Leptobrachium leishanense TaxID=445787 RepID=A0A8C5N4X8_9ANUR